ncbi:MAG TPA: hypothetical protein VG405_10800 [Solirubrobacteraceae bacterium]|nr:hypothetical protein [Solirubrobacteraceae bacterium]
MSYVIVLSVVTVEAANLALLWVALRVSMSRVVRPLVAGFGVSGAWGAWVLVLVLRGPLWMMAITGFVFALSAVAMGIAIHLATAEEEDHRDGGGGGAPTVSSDSPGGGGNDEPLWWAEFEGQVAAYAARSAREAQPVER